MNAENTAPVAQVANPETSAVEDLIIDHLRARKDRAQVVIVTANTVIRDIYIQGLLYKQGSGIKRYTLESSTMDHIGGGSVKFFQMKRVLHGVLRGLEISMGVYDPTGASFQAQDVKTVVYRNLHNAVFSSKSGILVQASQGQVTGIVGPDLGPIPQI